MHKHTLTAISAAIALAMSASAMGGTTSDAQYKADQESISARHGSDQAACKSMAGNANDVCMAEANGRESVAKAKLEATRGNSEQHRQDVRIAEANAASAIANDATSEAGKKAATENRDVAYAVAKEKCGSLADDAKAACIKEAKAHHGQS